MFHLKGAVSRIAEGETAFGNRHASHAITLDGVWRPGEDLGERDSTHLPELRDDLIDVITEHAFSCSSPR
jgi:hypothetical protein